MSDSYLQHQLSELKSVKTAPVLWRQQTKSQLLQKIAGTVEQPYTWREQVWQTWQQIRFVLAPWRLAPVMAFVLILLVGYTPVTSALAASLPGSPWYPLKRTVEKIELSLRSSADSQGLFYLTLAGRRLAEAKAMSADSAIQAVLLRDYNISLGFAAASLEQDLPSTELAKAYDQATDFLSANLNSLVVPLQNRQVYKSAVDLTNKISARSLALLVSQHKEGSNNLTADDVAQRLATEIAKVEAKLETVEVKAKEFPATKPAPRVVWERQAVIVPVTEASKQAKASLNEARELIARKEFSLALEKVQESEDLTSKSEVAVETEITAAAEESSAKDIKTPVPAGEVKGENVIPQQEAKPEAGGLGETDKININNE